jgi:Na+/H+ antiporter NhaC
MAGILENILIMILTVLVLLGGGYLVLVILGWGMKLKSGHREQEGLTDLLSTLQHRQNVQNTSTDQQSDNNE